MGGNTRNHIKKALRWLHSIGTWQYLLVLIVMLFISATCLRIDHIRMNDLKNEVLSADQAGDEEKLITSLNSLRDYTNSHIVINIDDMNGNFEVYFGTGPFYLENQYRSDATKVLEEAEKNNPDGLGSNVFAEAANVCRPQAIAGGWAWNSPEYLNCMTSEIDKHPASDDFQSSVILPSTELYRYNFASPVWAPTITGFVLLVTALLALIIIIRFIVWAVLKIALRVMKN
ncbi:hypothetical protein IJI91_00400 [Candidatus Saccharibacteria bacterium]|nr:hypothetical protein [Candidatus Saccharibacteria bacterium]